MTGGENISTSLQLETKLKYTICSINMEVFQNFLKTGTFECSANVIPNPTQSNISPSDLLTGSATFFANDVPRMEEAHDTLQLSNIDAFQNYGDFDLIQENNAVDAEGFDAASHLVDLIANEHADVYSHLDCLGNDQVASDKQFSAMNDDEVTSTTYSHDNACTDPPDPSESTDDSNKPIRSYVELIAECILNSTSGHVVLHDIYEYVLKKYPYYRSAKPAWKISIRHHLSTNEFFTKVGRVPHSRGYYWSVHPACKEDFTKGNFNVRLARRRVQVASREANGKSPSVAQAQSHVKPSTTSASGTLPSRLSGLLSGLMAKNCESSKCAGEGYITYDHPFAFLATRCTYDEYMASIIAFNRASYQQEVDEWLACKTCKLEQDKKSQRGAGSKKREREFPVHFERHDLCPLIAAQELIGNRADVSMPGNQVMTTTQSQSVNYLPSDWCNGQLDYAAYATNNADYFHFETEQFTEFGSPAVEADVEGLKHGAMCLPGTEFSDYDQA